MKLLHTTLPLSPVITALLIGIIPAGATSIGAGNINTGSQSTNTVTIIEETEIITQTNSITKSTNTFTFGLNSGGNTADQNTDGGDIKSGSIAMEFIEKNQPAAASPIIVTNQPANDSAVNESATVSNNDPIIIIAPDSASLALSNINTGADSANSTNVSISKKVSVTSTDVKSETEKFDLDLNTGNNTASQNTRGGSIESGSINVFVKKETLPPPQPPKPTPSPTPTPPSPSQPPAPSIPTPSPSAPQPTHEQPATPLLLAQKLAELIPTQPTQIITAAGQPAPQPTAPTSAPTAKLPRAGAETPLIAILLSAGSLRTGHYLRQKRRELKYKNQGPW